jgi:hypothetical protein
MIMTPPPEAWGGTTLVRSAQGFGAAPSDLKDKLTRVLYEI